MFKLGGKMIKLLSERAVKKGDCIYMLSKEAGMIFSINLKDGKVHIECCLENENFFQSRLYGDIKFYNDEIILIPANSNAVCVLDSKFRIIKKIQLSEKYGHEKYMTSQILGDNLYVFGHGVFGSKIVNLKSYEITEIKELEQELFYSSAIVGKTIYLPSCKTNKLYIYNVESGEINEVIIGDISYNSICIKDSKCYLAPRNSKAIYIYDLLDNSIIKKEIPFCNAIGIFDIGNEIYVPSDCKGRSLKVDKDMQVFTWKVDKRLIFSRVIGDEVFIMSDDAELSVYNRNSNEERKYMSVIHQKDLDNFIKENEIKIQLDNRETNINSLNMYIRSI